MSKNKTKIRIESTISQRVILRDGETIKLKNKSGTELLVTVFPAIHHE